MIAELSIVRRVRARQLCTSSRYPCRTVGRGMTGVLRAGRNADMISMATLNRPSESLRTRPIRTSSLRSRRKVLLDLVAYSLARRGLIKGI